jgi:hypothetical protein
MHEGRHTCKVMSKEFQTVFRADLSHSTLRTLALLPSIMKKIDDILLVKELNGILFEHAILEQHLYAAITPPANAIEFDYERLETLGKSFYITYHNNF